MCEYSIEELLANWKYKRAEEKEDVNELGQYKKLPYSLTELETLIAEQLPYGGVLSAYAKVSNCLGHSIGERVYAEILRLYELCNGCRYFDISELEDVIHMEVEPEYEKNDNVPLFVKTFISIVVRCPCNIAVRDKIYNVQRHLFRVGEDDDVWLAYRNGFFPKEMLEEFYYQEKLHCETKNKKKLNYQLTWLIAWISV